LFSSPSLSDSVVEVRIFDGVSKGNKETSIIVVQMSVKGEGGSAEDEGS
jgi:hypothetical protein